MSHEFQAFSLFDAVKSVSMTDFTSLWLHSIRLLSLTLLKVVMQVIPPNMNNMDEQSENGEKWTTVWFCKEAVKSDATDQDVMLNDTGSQSHS